MTARGPERFALQVTIGAATQQKLLRAQALHRHQVPSGDLAELLDRALDALLDKVEGRKLGKTRAPRTAKPCADGRYVSRAARRQAVAGWHAVGGAGTDCREPLPQRDWGWGRRAGREAALRYATPWARAT